AGKAIASRNKLVNAAYSGSASNHLSRADQLIASTNTRYTIRTPITANGSTVIEYQRSGRPRNMITMPYSHMNGWRSAVPAFTMNSRNSPPAQAHRCRSQSLGVEGTAVGTGKGTWPTV